MTLLCPQQWAKQRETDFGWEDGAQFITKGNFSVFQWDNGNSIITVPMDAHTNLPILTTVPGFQGSAKLIANLATPAVVSDDEDSDGEDDEETVQVSNASHPQNPTLKTFPFKQVREPVVVPDQVLPKDQEEFLHLHEKLGHVSFHALQKMATCGLIPSKFKHCRIPTCASCQHGKQHKRPWRTKNADPSPIGGKKS